MTGGPAVMKELRAIQRANGYIPATALNELSERTGTPLYQIQGVVSFYPHFRTTPAPPVEVLVCDDLSCHRRGAAALLAETQERVAGSAPAGSVVRASSCLGRCDRAPACAVNDVVVTRVTGDSLMDAVAAAAAGTPLRGDAVVRDPRKLDVDPYGSGEPYGAVRKLAASGDTDALIASLKASDLRGMGGAGFPTGLKWEIVRNAPGDPKYIVCNADESEPGTFKDRVLLDERAAPAGGRHDPGRPGDGGAARQRLHPPRVRGPDRDRRAARSPRPRPPACSGPTSWAPACAFELEVFVSPGGYICGEESGAARGAGGQARRAAQQAAVPRHPRAVRQAHRHQQRRDVRDGAGRSWRDGPEWFKAQGKSGAAGLKFVGISGDVARPGVYEIAMGTPARRSSSTGPAAWPAAARSRRGRRRDRRPASCRPPCSTRRSISSRWPQAGSMLGSGALWSCDDRACMLDMALNAVRFFRNESCGKCVPCRVGSAKLVEMLGQIARGEGRAEHLPMIDDLSHAMTLTSICGLGQVVPVPIRSVLTHFREELDDHLLRPPLPRRRVRAAGMTPTAAAVRLTIDGRETNVPTGTTIIDAARGLGIDIPTLCHAQHQTPVGVCRVCTVEVEEPARAGGGLRAAGRRGHGGTTASDGVRRARRTLAELLLADHASPARASGPPATASWRRWAAAYGVGVPRFAAHALTAGARRLLALHRGGPHRVHPVRPLHPRLPRGEAELRHRPHGQGLHDGHRLRHRRAHGSLDLRGLRRVHGLLPDRRAHQSARCSTSTCRAATTCRADELKSLPIFARMSGTFLELNRARWSDGASVPAR